MGNIRDITDTYPRHILDISLTYLGLGSKVTAVLLDQANRLIPVLLFRTRQEIQWSPILAFVWGLVGVEVRRQIISFNVMPTKKWCQMQFFTGFYYSIALHLLVARETAPVLTSDMGGKTVLVLVH